MNAITMTPIGVVRSTRAALCDDDRDREQARRGALLYGPRRCQKLETAARHPRNNPNWPEVGSLAQRAKNRPNQIGSTVCRVLRAEGTRLFLAGLDAVDGSPVLDISPRCESSRRAVRFVSRLGSAS